MGDPKEAAPELLPKESELIAQALQCFYGGQDTEGRDALRGVRQPVLNHLYTAGLRLGIEADQLCKGADAKVEKKPATVLSVR